MALRLRTRAGACPPVCLWLSRSSCGLSGDPFTRVLAEVMDMDGHGGAAQRSADLRQPRSAGSPPSDAILALG